ncbi:MAG: stringent starvation protein A [marine bacterium B5-7]|nr:MAG: stringent starvation protein A [marine bacterium B5-7]
MTLFSGTDCPYSQTARIVLQEKDVECESRFFDDSEELEQLAEFNPYLETPTLLDRDVVLYDSALICEYLDERLPHPPLMAVDPVGRSRIRLLIHRLRRDWIDSVKQLGGKYDDLSDETRALIRDGLISISPIFREQKYLFGEDYSMADVFAAPLLWRLPALGIKLPKPAAPLKEYSERLFNRAAFTVSLTEAERALR